MNKSIYTRDDFIGYLKKLADKYALNIADSYNATQFRNDLYFPIKSCKENNVDIHDLFPIEIKCGEYMTFKFYQNGDMYAHTPYRIICLHNSYGSDSICQDK